MARGLPLSGLHLRARRGVRRRRDGTARGAPAADLRARPPNRLTDAVPAPARPLAALRRRAGDPPGAGRDLRAGAARRRRRGRSITRSPARGHLRGVRAGRGPRPLGRRSVQPASQYLAAVLLLRRGGFVAPGEALPDARAAVVANRRRPCHLGLLPAVGPTLRA